MAYEHKDGQGSMFRNEKQNDRQPDYKGTIVINGTTYEMAGWERTSQRGSSYISLQASLPREKQEQGQQPSQYSQRYQQRPEAPAFHEPAPTVPMPTADDMPAFGPDDDLPF